MAESNHPFNLQVIATVIDESRLKIICKSQCIKAQTFVANKLKDECDRYTEICYSITRENSILDSEIQTGQQEILSLTRALDSIKNANEDLQKELLLAKMNNQNISKRLQHKTESKFEKLWLECKGRFESIPWVKTLNDAKAAAEHIQTQLNELENKAKELNREICFKKDAIAARDRKHIIELAYYIQVERPANIKLIKKRTKEINDLTKEIEHLKANKMENISKIGWQSQIHGRYNRLPNLRQNIHSDSSFMNSKLQIDNANLDIIHSKLNQIKKNLLTINKPENEKIIASNLDNNKIQTNVTQQTTGDYMSIYFRKCPYNKPEVENYPKRRKLIHIIQDIKMDKASAIQLMLKASVENLQPVDSISSEISVLNKISQSQPIVSEIEEINMSGDGEPLQPPSQFVDIVEVEENYSGVIQTTTKEKQLLEDERHSSQNKEKTKVVSFDESIPMEMHEMDGAEESENKTNIEDKKDANESIRSAVEDEFNDDVRRIKEIMMKRDELNSSPQFNYSRINNLRENQGVTSKFFKRNEQVNSITNILSEKSTKREKTVENLANVKQNTSKALIDTVRSKDVDGSNNPPPTPVEPSTEMNLNQTAEELPTPLDVSVNTTGFYGGEADYPHLIDTSLLLSPKADIPMASENPQELSQGVPNFLSSKYQLTNDPWDIEMMSEWLSSLNKWIHVYGMRKNVFPFLGQMQIESRPDSNEQNGSKFCFNFGTQEKNRYGLFNLFK